MEFMQTQSVLQPTAMEESATTVKNVVAAKKISRIRKSPQLEDEMPDNISLSKLHALSSRNVCSLHIFH